MNKICKKCKEEKILTDFGKDKTKSDGYFSYCKTCKSDIDLTYYTKNKNKILKNMLFYYSTNVEKIKLYQKQYRDMQDKALVQKYQKEYKEKNRMHLLDKKRVYIKHRRSIDPMYCLIHSLRVRTNSVFKNKSKSTLELLGCSIEQLKHHLESQFQPGMTWENYGKWHIDHKYPLSKALSKEHLFELCHYTNLQPLWKMDNIKKSNKLASDIILNK